MPKSKTVNRVDVSLISFPELTLPSYLGNFTFEETEVPTYGMGERIVFEKDANSTCAITFNSVVTTNERFPFDDESPEQVIVVNYTYENIEGDDLFISGMLHFKVMDEDGNLADDYLGISKHPPKSTPAGAKCTADEAYGLEKTSETIKLGLYLNMHSKNADFILEIS